MSKNSQKTLKNPKPKRRLPPLQAESLTEPESIIIEEAGKPTAP